MFKGAVECKFYPPFTVLIIHLLERECPITLRFFFRFFNADVTKFEICSLMSRCGRISSKVLEFLPQNFHKFWDSLIYGGCDYTCESKCLVMENYNFPRTNLQIFNWLYCLLTTSRFLRSWPRGQAVTFAPELMGLNTGWTWLVFQYECNWNNCSITDFLSSAQVLS